MLERNGSDTRQGEPVAFIETAWRRYTKHSRNKAQEIQGAILPLCETHTFAAPFVGVVLAGEFSPDTLTQLRSHQFQVLHFSYKSVLEVFHRYGIDAGSTEATPDAEFVRKVQKWQRLTAAKKRHLAADLAQAGGADLKAFTAALEAAISRPIHTIHVIPLHGTAVELQSVETAIHFIESRQPRKSSHPFVKYEIDVRFNNGDQIQAEFRSNDDAVRFLRGFESPFTPAN